MTGKIKVIGANNRSHLEWMEKEFENCSICHNGNTLHLIKIPDRGEIPFEIYKSIFIEDRIILEGYAHIEDSLGRLGIEFFPQ
jgi:hypothetical protein